MESVRHFEEVGFHRPLQAASSKDDRFIVRGNDVVRWQGGGSFFNFLEKDLLMRMGSSFSEHEQRHPLHEWWSAMRSQAKSRRHLGEKRGLFSTAATLNFFTTAYDLFVLSDNARIRDRLLKSMRVPEQFHGARYELMIAACLLRAGFTVEFTNEEDSNVKHCDFIVCHRKFKTEYFAEVKAKGRAGMLGKPGERQEAEKMKRNVSRLLRDALLKPADGQRLIIVDMNLPPLANIGQGKVLPWQDDAVASVNTLAARGSDVPSAFVVFTNSPSYYAPPDVPYEGLETAFSGFNISDFAKGLPTLGEACPDMADLFQAFKLHGTIPDEFPHS